MKIKDMVSLTQYKKIEQVANNRLTTINNMKSTLAKAQGILDAPITKENLKNAIIALESLQSKGFMMKFVTIHINKSVKTPTPTSYCGMIKRKCEITGRIYNGYNKIYKTFNNLPEWFVYETYKETAIKTVPNGFSIRFIKALAAFVLSQQKYIDKY